MQWAAGLLLIINTACSNPMSTPPLFENDPDISHILADFNLDVIIAGAPQPDFVSLTYENHISDEQAGKKTRTYTNTVHLERFAKGLSVLRTESYTFQPGGDSALEATRTDVGIPGLISFASLDTKQRHPDRIQLRTLARNIDNLQGRLFPLEEGNELAFDLVCDYQITQRDIHQTPHPLTWRYRFRVVDRYDGSQIDVLEMPGDVFVIERTEWSPDDYSDVTQIHYATELGIVIKTVRHIDAYTEELRLVNMELASD